MSSLLPTLLNILDCHAITWEEKLNLLMRRSFASAEEPDFDISRKNINDQDHPSNIYKTNRRMYDFHPGMRSPILGTPTRPNQLPEAEPILPGHTLLRPAMNMLKSAVKFPHKDMEDGAGVYGNINSLGITYGGTGERVLYTGFRRNNDNIGNIRPRPLIVALLRKRDNLKDAFNHIYINPDAPHITELMPKAENGDRLWWFFNQIDSSNLKDK